MNRRHEPGVLERVIPYFQLPSLQLGPFVLQSLGLFAVAGVALAAWLLVREAGRAGVDPAPLREVPPWAIAGGVLGGSLATALWFKARRLAFSGARRDGGTA